MRIVVKKVGEKPEVREIEDNLEAFKEIVGGYKEIAGGYIECVTLTHNVFSRLYNVICVCNEEGKLMGLPGNFFFGLDVIVGDVFFCAVNGEDFDSLNDDQIDCLMSVFNN